MIESLTWHLEVRQQKDILYDTRKESKFHCIISRSQERDRLNWIDAKTPEHGKTYDFGSS